MFLRGLRPIGMVVVIATVLMGTVSQAALAKDESTHFGELTTDAEHLTGYFDIYTKDGNVYLEIPLGDMDKDFLLSTSLSKGIGTHGFLGGMPLAYFEAQT